MSSGGEPGRFAWADFKRLFNERYFSPSHHIQIQDEFLNLRKGSMSVQEFQPEVPFSGSPFASHGGYGEHQDPPVYSGFGWSLH